MTRRRESRLRRVVLERAGWRCEYCAPRRDQPAKPSILTISFQRFSEVSGQRKIWRSLVRIVTSLAVGSSQDATRAQVKWSACSIRAETFGRDTFVGVQIGHD